MNLLVVLNLVVGLLIYGILRLGEYAWVTLKRKGTVQVIWVDPDAGAVRIAYEKRKGNTIDKGELGVFILDGKARLNGAHAGGSWLLHARHGWNMIVGAASRIGDNLVAPTDEETVQRDPALAMLAVANPQSYRHAIMHNEARDALEANKEPDDWIKTALVCGLVALVVIFGVLAFIAWRITHAAQGAAQ